MDDSRQPESGQAPVNELQNDEDIAAQIVVTPVVDSLAGLTVATQAVELPAAAALAEAATLPRHGSPVDSLLSVPAGSPSVQDSIISSPGSSVLPSVAFRPHLPSPTPSLRPFDRRFQSRMLSQRLLPSSPPNSPAPWSRPGSMLGRDLTGSPTPPWEVVRWTRLAKLAGHIFSEAGRRSFGAPASLALSVDAIVLGTDKGVILTLDYGQNIRAVIGPGTRAIDSGAVVSLAVSFDQTTIAAGHANGDIYTWETTKPSRPFLHIPHVARQPLAPGQQLDGHVPNAAVIHIGFLGRRRTALVSADDGGMAFSHLATRGTGPLGRSIKTARLLGRYPDFSSPSSAPSSQPPKPTKSSTVLAFAPLPLGNAERATDWMGLSAMLTPHLLVIVSTTPIAQTQYKSARPKDVAVHDACIGCLAWFPASRVRTGIDNGTGDAAASAAAATTAPAKLVYCWSSVLSVLDVHEIPSDDPDKPNSLDFRPRSRWRADEPIVAVQWVSRFVITLLTASQRLVVLEDGSLRVTDGFELLNRHIYHADLFSTPLRGLVEIAGSGSGGTALPAVVPAVPDAFFMSFKTYRDRIFLLGFGDVTIGALTNWQDRLGALMQHGDFIGAIQLATSYHAGDADKRTVGLPDDSAVRHGMVRGKLVEVVKASIRHYLDQRRMTLKTRKQQKSVKGRSGSVESGDNDEGRNMAEDRLRELTETCFVACGTAYAQDFLLEEGFDMYDDGGQAAVFLEVLDPYIRDGSIQTAPPSVVKALVTHYAAQDWQSRLEELICRLDTASLDLDQITQLCRQHGLYDALIYVWNRAMADYITPLVDLLKLLPPPAGAAAVAAEGGGKRGERGESEKGDGTVDDVVNAGKIFPYLAAVLTGRIYPTGAAMGELEAARAKLDLYWFFFSGGTVRWPRGVGPVVRTRPGHEVEPSFPYLQRLLRFDAASFLSALNEAFEDPFLNDAGASTVAENQAGVGAVPEVERTFGQTINRQYIVSILLELMTPPDFGPADTIYLDMFVARNLAKFPQYILLPGWALGRVLAGLCAFPGPELAEDAQLSAEYLLSTFQPPNMAAMVPQMRQAGFFRVLKRFYRAERQFDLLIETYFEDPDDRAGVFDCIADCLRSLAAAAGGPGHQRQLALVRDIIARHSLDLLQLDAARTARTLALALEPTELHSRMLDAADQAPGLQHGYLDALLGPGTLAVGGDGSGELVERYVRLMCQFEPARVAEYVSTVQVAADLRLDQVLSAMEDGGAVDAAVVLMARDGLVRGAMDRLVAHLGTLEGAVEGVLLQSPAGTTVDAVSVTKAMTVDEAVGEQGEEATAAAAEAAEELLKALQKYVHVGIWLCQHQAKTAQPPSRKSDTLSVSASVSLPLSPTESLWLSLVEATVRATRRLTAAISSAAGADEGKRLHLARSLVQHTFTALVASTAAPPAGDASFLRVLRAFLTRAAASSPTVADLRAVLQSVFAAYAYEESILRLANRLLDRSLFSSVSRVASLRQRGWRPRSPACEACARRAWGPGALGNLYEAWEERRAATARLRRPPSAKGKAPEPPPPPPGPTSAAPLGPIVVFACRHVYHQACLVALVDPSGQHGRAAFRCPIDG